MIRIYTASKLRHGHMWRKICDNRSDVILHARWLKHIPIGTPDDPMNAPAFWLQDQQDIRDSDAVLVYAEPTDMLRGALVEVGMALAYGVPVIVVGDHEDYGTWRWHPLVHWAPDIDAAIALAKTFKHRYMSVDL